MFNSRRSLKLKLLLPILLFVGAIFVFSQVMTYQTTFEREKENLIERVKVLANGVAYNLEAAIVFDDSIAASEILSAFSADDEVQRVKLFTRDNQLFASYVDKRVATYQYRMNSKEKRSSKINFRLQKTISFWLFPLRLKVHTSRICESRFQNHILIYSLPILLRAVWDSLRYYLSLGSFYFG